MMTKHEERLERIATKMAAAFVSNPRWLKKAQKAADKAKAENDEIHDALARLSYDMAEALIKEGDKRKEDGKFKG